MTFCCEVTSAERAPYSKHGMSREGHVVHNDLQLRHHSRSYPTEPVILMSFCFNYRFPEYDSRKQDDPWHHLSKNTEETLNHQSHLRTYLAEKHSVHTAWLMTSKWVCTWSSVRRGLKNMEDWTVAWGAHMLLSTHSSAQEVVSDPSYHGGIHLHYFPFLT